MTPAQFRASLARLGLTQASAARICGVNARTARRWAHEVDAPPTVARLLWACEQVPKLASLLLELNEESSGL